jgi:uncharacterized protein (DUF1800 family)
MIWFETRRHLRFANLWRVAAVATVLSLLIQNFGVYALAQKRPSPANRLTEEQRIVHVLNRLGFGVRPGDIERVKALGIENYINQQLAPEKIADNVAEDKVRSLATLSMTTAELYEKYPQPGMLLRQLERRGQLPAELEQARQTKEPKSPGSVEAPTQQQAMPAPGSAPQPPQDNEAYRRVLREYYRQNGLQQPARIIAELQASRILRAVYSERQLNEVMVDFWSNHFNVFANKGADRWLLTGYDRDTIRPHAMGKFSELLVATAQSPAMLFYLDNFQSVSPRAEARPGQLQRRAQDPFFDRLMKNPRREEMIDRNPNLRRQLPASNTPENRPSPPQRQRRGINENYARELMELHTLGVDGGYTQKDVQEVARCFTGWTIFAPRGGAAAATPLGDAARANAGTFFFNARMHDDGEKIVLGHKIPAGGGIKDGLTVLDILARHPATAKFISQKLVRHFVMDTPPPALVDRVAAVFTKSDGDIRETLRAIFFSPEFNSSLAYRTKIKRPFELAISALRTLGADTNGGPQLHQWIARMGEPLYGFQTPNGYSDTAESWVNTGGLLERLNFGLALASNRIPGTRLDLKRFLAGGASSEVLDKREVMSRFLNVLVGGDISPTTRETLLAQMDQQGTTTLQASSRMDPNGDVSKEEMAMSDSRRVRGPNRMDVSVNDPVTKIVGLILGSPEFQRQ